MKIIGLTGASASGKSTVSKIFSEFKAEVLDADKIYHELLANSKQMQAQIIHEFDLKSNKIDTKKLGEIVFSDKNKLKKLNEITHKFVRDEFEKKINQTTSEILILDVPLLFEAGFDKYCNKTIGVISKTDIKIERICKRDNVLEEYAKKRLENQKTNDFFLENCDIIIENNDTFEVLYEKCSKIIMGEK